jgi:hypothetical protein
LLARPVQIDRAINHKDTWGTTKYAPPIEQIVSRLMRGAALPWYVAFITDGGNSDRNNAADAVLRRVPFADVHPVHGDRPR